MSATDDIRDAVTRNPDVVYQLFPVGVGEAGTASEWAVQLVEAVTGQPITRPANMARLRHNLHTYALDNATGIV